MSAASPGLSSQRLDGVGDGFGGLDVDRWIAFLVAARGLLALVLRRLDAQPIEQLVVHIARVVAVRSDEDDDDPLGLGPDGEETVAAVEVSAAHVLQLFASESVATGFAALVLKLAEDTNGGLPPTTAEVSNLAVGDDRQADFDRGFLALCLRFAISACRSSPSGTTRRAVRSANPSSAPASAARSLRMPITLIKS